jgi:hypothetical protein
MLHAFKGVEVGGGEGVDRGAVIFLCFLNEWILCEFLILTMKSETEVLLLWNPKYHQKTFSFHLQLH